MKIEAEVVQVRCGPLGGSVTVVAKESIMGHFTPYTVYTNDQIVGLEVGDDVVIEIKRIELRMNRQQHVESLIKKV